MKIARKQSLKTEFTILAILLVIFSGIVLHFQNNYAETYDEAMTKSKPFVLYVYMKDFEPCDKFNLAYAAMKNKYGMKFNFAKHENIEPKMVQLTQAYKVDQYPAVFIINPKTNSGKIIPTRCTVDNACLDATLKSYEP